MLSVCNKKHDKALQCAAKLRGPAEVFGTGIALRLRIAVTDDSRSIAILLLSLARLAVNAVMYQLLIKKIISSHRKRFYLGVHAAGGVEIHVFVYRHVIAL